MKKSVNFTLLFLFYNPLFAQMQISGTVQDPEGQPLSYANVLLLSVLDSSLVKGAVSEHNGGFSVEELENKAYLLSISLVGYQSYIQKLPGSSQAVVQLPPTILQEMEEELEEITVTAKKPLYEKQIDRMVVNVQESITAAGNTVLEVLSRSPGVFINQQQYSISLNGREGIMVMINNTLSRMPMETVLQLLEGMSAANVEKIELITQPPAHLDAEGGGGIIHIVMKENTDLGTNANFGLTAGMKRREVLGANFNINHRTKGYSLFADYSVLHFRNLALWSNDFNGLSQTGEGYRFHANMDRRPISQTHQFRTGIEKNIGKNTEVAAVFNYINKYTHFKGEGNSVLRSGDSTVWGDINYSESRYVQTPGAHAHLVQRLSSKHSFRIDYDWLFNQLESPSTYDNTHYISPQNSTVDFIMEIESITSMNFHIAALDYTFQPFTNLNLKTGIKKSWMNFENSVQSYSGQNGIRLPDPMVSISALMKEDVSAAYISGDWNVSDFMQVKGGLRYEHTITDIRSAAGEQYVYRNFGNFFPNLLFQNKISKNMDFILGYSRRINRPNLNNLVPVVLMINSNTHFFGNPELLPAIMDNFKVDIKYNRVALSLEHSTVKNAIAPFQPRYDPEKELLIMHPENLAFLHTTGLFLTAPWIIADYWDLQATMQLLRRQFQTSHLEANQSHTLYDLHLNLVNTFELGRGYAAEVSGIYNSRKNWGMWIFRPQGSLNMGLQKKMKEDRGTFRFSITDLLNTTNYLIYADFQQPTLHTSVDYFVKGRTITLNYSRPFGNKRLKAVKIESSSEEDRKRMVVD
ncbi:MAG TPA: TonB-dependent receptor [Lunatimonas sp.]|nr:TonB-dependent receptor [Lunatimonas sp.]